MDTLSSVAVIKCRPTSKQVNLGIGHSPIKFSQPAIVIAYTQFDLCTVCMYSVSKKIPPPEGPDIFFHFLTNG